MNHLLLIIIVNSQDFNIYIIILYLIDIWLMQIYNNVHCMYLKINER